MEVYITEHDAHRTISMPLKVRLSIATSSVVILIVIYAFGCAAGEITMHGYSRSLVALRESFELLSVVFSPVVTLPVVLIIGGLSLVCRLIKTKRQLLFAFALLSLLALLIFGYAIALGRKTTL